MFCADDHEKHMYRCIYVYLCKFDLLASISK